jgi:hypothetical protein
MASERLPPPKPLKQQQANSGDYWQEEVASDDK